MTEERIKEIEGAFLKADRESLISYAKELDIWIGDVDELDDEALKNVIDCGIGMIKDRLWSLEESEGTIRNKNQILDSLYSFCSSNSDIHFADELKELIDDVRYMEFPDLTGSEWFYTILFTQKEFKIDISKWEGNDDEMSVSCCSTFIKRDLKIPRKVPEIIFSYMARNYMMFT